MLDANPTPRTTGLHGVSLPRLPWLPQKPTLARAVAVPAGYRRVLGRKAARRIEALMAMPADRPVTSLEMVTPTSNRDNTASALAHLVRKGLAKSDADPASTNGGRLYRLTPAGKREQAAQRAGA